MMPLNRPVIQLAHDVLCADSDEEAIYLFAFIIVKDEQAALALARVVHQDAPRLSHIFQYMIERHQQGHRPEPIDWQESDARDTADRLADHLREQGQ